MAYSGKNHKGGRPPGSKSPATLEKERVLAAMRQRIMQSADRILDGQFSIARGQQFLYKIEKEWIATGKGPKKGFWKSKKPVLVENEFEIRAYLDHLVEEGDMADENDSGAAFYYITTKEPNNFAIDSMLDRAFGRATQHQEVTGPDGQPLVIEIAKEIANKHDLKPGTRKNSK